MSGSGQHGGNATRGEKGDWAKFLGTWARNPLKMGAVASSSPAYCAEMVARSTTALDGPILELGAGLGVVTHALLEAGVAPERITSIEFDRDFAQALEKRFPAVNVICGDGLDLTHTLAGRDSERFATVLLAIPIVRFSQEKRRDLLSRYFERIRPGGNLTQLSYLWTPPVRPDPSRFSVSSSPVVWANIPPAKVWVYRRAGDERGQAGAH